MAMKTTHRWLVSWRDPITGNRRKSQPFPSEEEARAFASEQKIERHYLERRITCGVD